ncbi:MAG: hypothetical protein K2M03_03855 [Muribaculaceae bacterium]|nr:hypothetical protein [Muribaculaceae bacterium]
MKHKLLLILFGILGLIQPTHAQYRTLDLLGTWELISVTGKYQGFTGDFGDYDTDDDMPANFKYMYIGITSYEPQYPEKLYGLTASETNDVLSSQNDTAYGCFYYKTSDDPTATNEGGINDFFITDGNLLHLSLGDGGCCGTIIFIIESLTDEELVLKGLEDLCRVVYKRVGTSANTVNEVAADGTQTQYYNLNGMAVDTPSKGIYIEKSGKSVQKILNTNQ